MGKCICDYRYVIILYYDPLYDNSMILCLSLYDIMSIICIYYHMWYKMSISCDRCLWYMIYDQILHGIWHILRIPRIFLEISICHPRILMLPRILELEFGMLPRIRYSMIFINLNIKVFMRLIEYRSEQKRRSTVYHWD